MMVQNAPAANVDMRNEILKAATHLMAERGYNGMSLQAVADAVGIRKQSLLYHFPSKEELHRGVMAAHLAHWSETLPKLVAAVTGQQNPIDAVIGTVSDFLAADPDRARLLMREALDRPQEMRDMLAETGTVWRTAMCDLIRQGQRQGTVYDDVDPEAYVVQVIHLMIASVATHTVMRVLMADESDQESMQRQLREMLRLANRSLLRPRNQTEGASDA